MSEGGSWDFSPGEVIVPGRLALGHLGGGSRYEAWLAWDDHLFALAVAKLVRPAFVDDPDVRKAIAHEAEVARSLSHPVIVRCFDADVDGARPHLLLEHLDGPTLRASLRRWKGRISLEEVLPLALHLCSALHHLAQRGVIHLDVKPSNIVMGPSPRLIDLSVAIRTDAARRLRPGVGTRLYMAPEQCDPAGRGPVGPPADVWGLGACLYEALAGRRAFDGPEGTHPQLDGPPPPLPSHVPALLRDTVVACLSADPDARPTPAAVAGALEPLVAELAHPVRLGRRGLGFR